MKTKKKINEIVTLSLVTVLISILMFFYPILKPKIYDFLANKFSIISSKNNMLVHFIAVGQGDAVAINLPDGKIILIDAGPTSSNVSYTSYLKEKVLNGKRNKNIDYFVMTHADADHIGGALRLLKSFDIDTIYMPVITNETENYSELYEYINSKQYNLINNTDAETIENGYKIEFFGPLDLVDSNNSCPVIKVTFNNYSFIFTGDISSEIELGMVDTYGSMLDSDVLKVAHHGSKYSSCVEFLQIVTPKYAVISCGRNSYGHPTSEAINNLTSVGAKILRTDNDGNILFTVGNNYHLNLQTNSYYTTVASLDYRIMILVIDGVLIVCIIKTALKKPKRYLINSSKN